MNRRAPAPPPKSSSTTGRTVVLVALASAAAAFILGRGFANNKSSNSNPGTKTSTTAKPGTKGATTLPATATTLITVPPTSPPSAIKVVVLNGNGIQGTAGSRAKELVTLGYSQTTASDAAQNNSATSAVYYATAADQGAATALATKIGVKAIDAMPAVDKLAKDPTKLTGVNVVLLLGKDIASTPIAGAPATTAAVTPTTAAATTATTAAAKTTATTKK